MSETLYHWFRTWSITRPDVVHGMQGDMLPSRLSAEQIVAQYTAQTLRLYYNDEFMILRGPGRFREQYMLQASADYVTWSDLAFLDPIPGAVPGLVSYGRCRSCPNSIYNQDNFRVQLCDYCIREMTAGLRD